MPQYVNDDIYVGSLDNDAEAALYGISGQQYDRLQRNCEILGFDFKTVLKKVKKAVKKGVKKVARKVKGKASKALTAARSAAQAPEDAAMVPASAAPQVDRRVIIAGAGVAALLFILMRNKRKGR